MFFSEIHDSSRFKVLRMQINVFSLCSCDCILTQTPLFLLNVYLYQNVGKKKIQHRDNILIKHSVTIFNTLLHIQMLFHIAVFHCTLLLESEKMMPKCISGRSENCIVKPSLLIQIKIKNTL